MKKMLCLVGMALAAGTASAQSWGGLIGSWSLTSIYSFGGTDDTPTMKRQKLARAVALREEAAGLVAQDGGGLTPEHQAYVQRKARDILGPRSRRIGFLK